MKYCTMHVTTHIHTAHSAEGTERYYTSECEHLKQRRMAIVTKRKSERLSFLNETTHNIRPYAFAYVCPSVC